MFERILWKRIEFLGLFYIKISHGKHSGVFFLWGGGGAGAGAGVGAALVFGFHGKEKKNIG